MACFIAPVAEAIVTTCLTKAIKEKEKATKDQDSRECEVPKLHFSQKLSWLNNMLWGGSALLAFEHAWHGEITPFFPFLTAMESSEEALQMLHEISTVGVSMSLLVTAVWGLMVVVAGTMEKQARASINVTKKQ